MSFNDTVVNEMRPHFANERRMLLWMQVQMEKVMREYVAQFKSPEVDGQQLLSQLQALPDTSEGFLQLGGVLGKPSDTFSWEDLREEAYTEKYGI